MFNLKKTLLKKIILLTLIFLLFPFMLEAAEYTEVEIGNITRLKGVRENQLIGYGIVVGLNGSGDSSRSQATVQSVANMLQNFGVNVDANQVSSGNIAAVMVTASLPPFVHSGDQIDIAVSSLGDADSLQGGTLLLTPLKAPNGEIYASAQGPVSIGGYNVSGGGNTQRQNHPTAGRIPGGAMVEKELAGKIDSNNLTYILENPNFETASQIAARINNNLNSSAAARAVDSATVNVSVPDNYSNRVVEFIAEINRVKVRPGLKARVVIDEKTGTVVFTHNVKISTVAVAHGNLSVKISTSTEVSQPPPFSGGETVETEETQIEVDEGEESNLVVVRQENAIEDLVTALNAIGATPRDIISIIQKIKAAGALHAELELR
ncbi:Flagellar P-ring protein FlgI [Halanaerobium saccharolyticum subsp. saccharolyticum DSM 6643]|uniref:Flagellar P-ring protein n=1 Tax=Halanaerobium saccharolyticum subsp. saccharolyticum DSM 6643 TaxID=1293054 RepID=M5E3G5_9FIRM|nr:flagellar basal body P-ring protein FlgI [Halanaerobium saccharolyticum]CCU80752.1 Flagellar P-ring protein FlgI [Halanaerobium saccharolyticum subsp. saccharolyticum DSM 6643]